ncbi:hypothetical protein COK07_27445 [Bacillus thuringiensis]|uniref:hypothetical protein n=1 Tax=Bacillus thuringiensis TaxID=1428 RepID=UPI000BF5FA40|nr:hypothetical protein [Bacillus thuringiensis]PFP71475.1 hypothetical protein COK07_27445 [Bacillus thuringiensis]
MSEEKKKDKTEGVTQSPQDIIQPPYYTNYNMNYPNYGYANPYYGSTPQNYRQHSYNGVDQNQMNLISQALADGKIVRELEEAKYTTASISHEFEQPSLIRPDHQLVRVNQLGPWHTGPITFKSGVAVGGYSDLTLHRNGAFNFSGHFHVSGAISYNVSFAWAVRDSRGVVYVFAHQGRLHGTFESGSRDSNWNRAEINPAIAAGWNDLERGWRWRWNARVNADFGVFLDDIIKGVAAGMAVVSVVKLIV